MIVDQFSFSLEETTFQFRDDEARIMDVIDEYIYKDLDIKDQYADTEYQEILNDIMPFIAFELWKRAKTIFENLDVDERKVLVNAYHEYDTYKEE